MGLLGPWTGSEGRPQVRSIGALKTLTLPFQGSGHYSSDVPTPMEVISFLLND